MSKDSDDYDPEVESFMDYIRRKMEEKKSKQRSGTNRGVSNNPASTELPNTSQSIPGADAAPPQPDSLDTFLKMLIQGVQEAESIDEYIGRLRSLAAWLENEADRMQARDPINFHMSSALH